MKDGRAHLCEAIGRAFYARALTDNEGMRDVGGVVYAKSDADDEKDADEGVD